MMFIIWSMFFYLMIANVWTFAEKKMYGFSVPRLLDDIIAILFALSLAANLS